MYDTSCLRMMVSIEGSRSLRAPMNSDTQSSMSIGFLPNTYMTGNRYVLEDHMNKESNQYKINEECALAHTRVAVMYHYVGFNMLCSDFVHTATIWRSKHQPKVSCAEWYNDMPACHRMCLQGRIVGCGLRSLI